MKKIILSVVIFILIVCSLAAAGYFYWMYQKIKSNPNTIAVEEVKSVTQTISRFMDLPADEVPSLATITDIKKLKGQDFFKKGQNGDKVLIYTKAQKALLFRPSTSRIIEFAPLAITPNLNQQAPQVNLIPVAIYNGTTKVGLTNGVETKLKTISGISVISKENAQKRDYLNTLVIDISGSNAALVEKIASLLDGEVGFIPAGEKKPESGILIIAAE